MVTEICVEINLLRGIVAENCNIRVFIAQFWLIKLRLCCIFPPLKFCLCCLIVLWLWDCLADWRIGGTLGSSHCFFVENCPMTTGTYMLLGSRLPTFNERPQPQNIPDSWVSTQNLSGELVGPSMRKLQVEMIMIATWVPIQTSKTCLGLGWRTQTWISTQLRRSLRCLTWASLT